MRKIHNLDSIRNRVNEIFGNKYIVPEQEINGVKNKIIVFCKDCEQYFKIRLNSLLSGKGCIDCWYNSMRLSIDEIRTISFEKYGNKYYIPNQEIKNNKSKIKIHCNDCHNTFEIIVYGHFKGDGGCNKCAIKKRTINLNKVISQSKKIHGDLYEIDDQEIENSLSIIRIYCKKCNQYFNQRIHNHLSGCGCTNCKISKGEETIKRYLIKNNINYIPQKRFDDCKNKFKLPFDFYLPEYNICIEYDGIQHFKKIHNWDYDKTTINDTIKTNFCDSNDITLLRITHEDNIIEKLDKMISKK